MFDVGASELLMIAVVAIVVIGPKDMPRALRTAGRWVAQVRRVSGHFRSGIETMIREAEMEELERKWREQNAQIMAAHPDSGDDFDADGASSASASAESRAAPVAAASAETRAGPVETEAPALKAQAPKEQAPKEQAHAETTRKAAVEPETVAAEPQLPLGGPTTRQEP